MPEFFYPRLDPGVLPIVHHDQNDAWPGVAEAADAFLQDKPERIVVIPDKSSTGILMKSKWVRAEMGRICVIYRRSPCLAQRPVSPLRIRNRTVRFRPISDSQRRFVPLPRYRRALNQIPLVLSPRAVDNGVMDDPISSPAVAIIGGGPAGLIAADAPPSDRRAQFPRATGVAVTAWRRFPGRAAPAGAGVMRICGLLLVLLVGACSPWHDIPDDLAYKGMELGSGPYPKANRWESVDVALSTNFNYTNYLMKNDLSVTSIVYFCDQENMRVQHLGGSSVYSRYKEWIRIDSHENGADLTSPPYIYHIFIDTFNHGTRPMDRKEKDITILDFDLRQEPRDLCLRIYGSAINYEQHSNLVRIPKEELIKLFATAPRTLEN